MGVFFLLKMCKTYTFFYFRRLYLSWWGCSYLLFNKGLGQIKCNFFNEIGKKIIANKNIYKEYMLGEDSASKQITKKI